MSNEGSVGFESLPAKISLLDMVMVGAALSRKCIAHQCAPSGIANIPLCTL
jgi:hypothetical protein